MFHQAHHADSLQFLDPQDLPDCVKQTLEDPISSYNTGWSHGKEELQDGKKDTFKGSFYANPVVDEPTTDALLIQQHPAYFRANIWPNEHLPCLEPSFKSLGQMIIATGMLLLEHCDR